MLLTACGHKNGSKMSHASDVANVAASQNASSKVNDEQKYYTLGSFIGNSLKQQGFRLDIDKFEEGVRAGFDGTCKENREEISQLLKDKNLLSDTARSSYYMGADNGIAFREFEIAADVDNFAKGLRDAYSGVCKVSQETMQQVVDQFNEEVKENMSKKAVSQSAEFLETNRTAEGVKETASGLQYKVLKQGKGKKPAATDFVKVHYTGKLVNGQVFDSSVKRGEPATFQLTQVIPGWTEGLQLMNVGSKYELYIPAKLAYGDKGIENVIPGGATLIFEVELLEINPKQK